MRKNPILVAFRLRLERSDVERAHTLARQWLLGSVLSRVAYNVGATGDELKRARAVLERFARLVPEPHDEPHDSGREDER